MVYLGRTPFSQSASQKLEDSFYSFDTYDVTAKVIKVYCHHYFVTPNNTEKRKKPPPPHKMF
jgi:hypothetical protein